MMETFTDYALQPDSLLNGKYVIQRVLGRGGFGVTYLALDKTLNLRVAVKECLPRNAAWRDPDGVSVQWGVPAPQQEITLENFVREARKMAQIDRIPGVVRVREYFFENNSAYIAMDYVEGETLAERLKRTGSMSADECFRLLSPVMDALAQAHRRGLIHRDISPNNIMISHAEADAERAWLLDLGAAKDLGTRLFAPNVSAATQIVGTPGYAPLEQYAPDGKIGPWTDVYAMSATFLRCMTGQAPPPSTSRALQDSVPELLRTAPGAVGTALLKGLARSPEERYQSMSELRDALEKALPKPKPAFPIKALIFSAVLLVAASVSLFVFLTRPHAVASGECGGNASWTLDADGLLTISGTWKMADYDDGTAPWIDYQDDIFSVKILQGISSIGRKSFWCCENLQSVEIPDSVTSIEFCAFFGCNHLKSVAIPDSVTTIGNSSFYDCENLTNVALSNNLTKIGAHTFYNCKNLRNIEIPESVTEIGTEAFCACRALTSVTIPDSVTKIGAGAFLNCSALTRVSVPLNADIPDNAFDERTAVTKRNGSDEKESDAWWWEEAVRHALEQDEATFGNNASDADSDAATSEIVASGECGENASWTLDADGLLTVSGTGEMNNELSPWTDYQDDIFSVKILQGISLVGGLWHCKNLESVEIPNSVTTIGNGAFYQCENLANIELPEGVKSIGVQAFYGCVSLTSVTIPDSVTQIDSSAFEGCDNLISVSVPAGATITGNLFGEKAVITYR